MDVTTTIGKAADRYFARAKESPFIHGEDTWMKIRRDGEFPEVCKELIKYVPQFESVPEGISIESENRDEERYNALFFWLMNVICLALFHSNEVKKYEEHKNALEKLRKAIAGIKKCQDASVHLLGSTGYSLNDFRTVEEMLGKVRLDMSVNLEKLHQHFMSEVHIRDDHLQAAKSITYLTGAKSAEERTFARVLCETFTTTFRPRPDETFKARPDEMIARLTNAVLGSSLSGKQVGNTYKDWVRRTPE